MPMRTLHEIFEHELLAMVAAEKEGLLSLQQMKAEAKEPALREAVEQHVRETEGQLRRLDQVLDRLHAERREVTSAVMRGLAEEKHAFMAMGPAPALMDVYNAVATAKTEHVEIGAYEGLVRLAEQVGAEDAVEPLQKSLEEERRMLERVEDVRPLLLRAVGDAAEPDPTRVRSTR